MPTLRNILVSSTMLFTVLLIPNFACAADRNKVASAKKSASEIPTEWNDASTGYKIVRLTRRPGPNLSFYFHNNPFVPALSDDSDLMLFYGRSENGMQLFTLNLKTLKTRRLTDRPRGVRSEIVAPTLRQAFYQSQNEIYSVNVDTGTEKLVATLPDELRGSIST